MSGVERGAALDTRRLAVRRAVEATTDFAWLSRGDSVLIKPVCNSGNDYPATTDPAALAAMIGLLRERGAGRILVGDMSGAQFVRFSKDRTSGSSRALMKRNGLLAAAEDSGADVVAFEEAGWDGFFEEAPTAGENWRAPLMLPSVLAEVDHVVLMPRCGRHLLAGATLALKAAVGWWRHDSRLEYHHDAATFAEKTAESNTVPTLLAKQRLVVTGATKVLTTFGPDDGYVMEPETGLVIASTSVVAHDMVSLAWLNENRAATPEHRRDGPIDDPHRSALIVGGANRLICGWIGGIGKAFSSERLRPWNVDSIGQDKVLSRAFAVMGGVPDVTIADSGSAVPAQIRHRLETAAVA